MTSLAYRSHQFPLRGCLAERETPTIFLMAHILEVGGTQQHFAELAAALAETKFRVRLGCNLSHGYFAERLSAGWELAEFRLGSSLLSLTALSSARALARYLRGNRVAIAHSFSFYSNIMMIPVARIAQVPRVIGSHRQLGDLLTDLQFNLQMVSFRLCDRVVCNSKAAALRLVTRGLRPSKVVVIQNAVSPQIFAIGSRNKQSSCASEIKIGMIARMSPPKDHGLLIRAAARLKNKPFRIQLFVAGDGPERFRLESMTRQLGLTSQVTFLGQCSDMAGLLAKLDISVLASTSESSPNAVTESMAAGLPVIATETGGIPELISHGETGLLVPVGDDVQLADAIEYLAEHPELRKRLGQNARDFAMKHFGTDHVRQLYEQLYTELLDVQR